MVTVYLDSQHISRIASDRSDLKIALDNSRATLLFSQTHVVESLPKRLGPTDRELARLQFIMGPPSNGLIPWSDFPRKEFDTDNSSLETFRCEINDILFPDKILMRRSDVTRQAARAIKQALSQIPDANIRRARQATLIKRGQLTPAAIDIFVQQLANTTTEIRDSAGFMLPLLSAGGIYDFIAGKTSERDFNALYKEAIANPAVLAEQINRPELASLLDMSKFFWAQTDDLVANIDNLVDELVKVQTRTNNFDYKLVTKTLLSGTFSDDFKTRMASALVSKPVRLERLKSMPGTNLYINALWRYLLEKLDRHANVASSEFLKEIKFKRSDFADLNHLFYAPYVDIFGCDRTTRDLIRKTGATVKNIACSDDEVRDLLGQKRGSSNGPTATSST